MIEIKCAADNTASLAARCGVAADTAFVMTEREELLGCSLVKYDGVAAATIVWLDAPDMALSDALLRATLNALLVQRVERAALEAASARALAIKKGYFSANDDFELKIRDFFSKTACND